MSSLTPNFFLFFFFLAHKLPDETSELKESSFDLVCISVQVVSFRRCPRELEPLTLYVQRAASPQLLGERLASEQEVDLLKPTRRVETDGGRRAPIDTSACLEEEKLREASIGPRGSAEQLNPAECHAQSCMEDCGMTSPTHTHIYK